MPNHKTSSGFTVGAGDTDNFETLRWMVVFGGGHYTLNPVIGKNGLVIEGEFFKKLLHKLPIMFEGFNGAARGGFDGGVDAEENADDDSSEEGDGDDFPADIRSKWSNDGDEEGEKVTENETKYATRNGKDEGFKKELGENVAGGGTDGLSDADFAGAFGDGNEHNVHYADTTNDK